MQGTKSRHRIRRSTGTPNLSRIFIYQLGTFLQRIDRLRREMYAGDLELASIAEAISLSVIEALMRDAEWRKDYGELSKVVGATPQRGVNALSISQATGIPRETTRRKIKKLVAMGAVTQVQPGEYIMTPGFLQQAANPERIDQAMAEAMRFMNESLDRGLFSWSARQE